MSEYRAVVLAVGEPAQAFEYRFGGNVLRFLERHATVLGRHDRHHRGRGDCRGTSKGAPHALGNSLRFFIYFYPHDHHVATRGTAHDADAVTLIARILDEDISWIEEVVLHDVAIEPRCVGVACGDVGNVIFVYHRLSGSGESARNREAQAVSVDTVNSNSSFVVCMPSEKRMLPCMRSSDCCIARST